MSILKRILIVILVMILVVCAAGFLYLHYLGQRAVPDYNVDIQLKGLYEPVDVYRDSFAIPHIYAKNEHDLYMVVGYLSAQDRLWQMDLLRRVTEGRLSEIFGHSYVDTDLLLRALRFRDKSEKILLQADSAIINALNGYADGINQYILQNEQRLPFEFTILGYKPEKWEPYQTVNMIGYMAWDLKAGWNEILLSEIQKTVDSIHYNQLLPDTLNIQPYIYPSSASKNKFSNLIPDLLLYTAELQKLGVDVLEASNNWAVSGTKSTTGMPLLANDMHLSLSVPGIWYQMHQVVEGELNVTGLVLPCTPFVICGHNDSIAWGMTNTFVDNVDFYEETINPADSTKYRYNGEWLSFENRKTVIKTKNGDEIEKTLVFTQRGPVVSSFKNVEGKVVSMQWAGDKMSNEIKSVFLLDRANNWEDFTNALRTFNAISQNVVYADKKGNIGLYCAAGVPIRKRDIAFGILPGDTDEYDWKGYVPFDELPHIYNPANGYVASANNRTASPEYPYHIGTWYFLPDRFERITELLSVNQKLSVDDFRAIQLDQKSKLAERYMPVLINALSGFNNMSQIESKSFEILRGWDYTMNSNSPAAAIFETFYLQFIRSTFEDELGNDLFVSFNDVSSVSRIATNQLINNRTSVWFDNITTANKTETESDIIISSFIQSVQDLSQKLGDDPDTWEWGSIHHLVLAHPLSAEKVLDRLFHLNPGPFSVGGSFHTVSPYTYINNKPFDANHGSSHRHIFDLGNWDNSLTVIPTGASGIPASKHYCDQTDLYVTGKYHPDYFTRDKIISHARYHMRFVQ
jgi:penicillin G amidase